MNIVERIKKIPGLYTVGKVSQEEIEKAEKNLNIKFPEEYREFLKEFGAVSFYGTEICGLKVPEYLNVVDTTLEERELNREFPDNVFIVERMNIDNIIAFSDESGQIFIADDKKIKKIADSFMEYIEICAKRK